VVAVARGNVTVTGGGIGHVTTLTGASRVAVPAATPSSGAGASQSPAVQAPAGAVFPGVAGHVTRLLVRVGQRVVAGQPVASLSDDGAMAGTVLQARSDLATARLELAQRRVQDPARGAPPTAAERASGRAAVLAARAKLQRLQGPPLPADVATARLDVAKAVADLRSSQAGTPLAISAAELAVATAEHKLQTVTGAPDAADLAAAQLELAKAALDQETLLLAPPAPSATAVKAAELAVALGRRRLADAEAAGSPGELVAARAALAKAESDRETLLQPRPGPTSAARTAAQLAVDAARRRLDALVHPPAAVVSAALQELARARAEEATLRATRGASGLAVSRAAVTAARRKLAQVVGPPTPDVIAAARLDVRKARADLAVLRQRGAPAGATDLALARLKVNVAAQRVDLARQLRSRLTVRAGASGTVTSVLTTKGAAVDATTPVARVQDLAHLVVTLDLSEYDVSRTRVGAPARVRVDALGGRRVAGHVLDVALSGTETGGVVSFPVIVALNARGRLRPGMSVSVRIVVGSRRAVVRIPVAAVSEGDTTTVMVREPAGTFRPRTIELGLTGARFVEVRSGLRAGERILASAPAGP
jgi:RND family efflux transporter MFP subunit